MATGAILMLFILPTCENVWALSFDHVFLESQSYSGDAKLPDQDRIHLFDIFCGTQHVSNSPYEDCCDSDPEKLDASFPLRENETGQSASKKEAFIGRVFAFPEMMRDARGISDGPDPIPAVFDKQTYANLIGIIKSLD